MKRIYLVLLALLLLVLAGCTGGAARQSAQLGEAFTLAGGETVDIEPANMSLTFSDVLVDSRCPALVSCFWTGEARIRLTAQSGEGEKEDLEFNTNPAPGMTLLTAEYDGYSVELQQLDPYPQDPDKPIKFADYQATLLVRELDGNAGGE